MRWLGQLFLGTTFALCFWMSARRLGEHAHRQRADLVQPGLERSERRAVSSGVWIAVAFFGVYRFFAYIDRRIRLEGWELDLRLKAVARGLEARAADDDRAIFAGVLVLSSGLPSRASVPATVWPGSRGHFGVAGSRCRRRAASACGQGKLPVVRFRRRPACGRSGPRACRG